MKTLPIDEILPKLLQTVGSHANVVLHAPPGAGKTTRVPLALLDIIPPANGRIIMLEPRRIAAASAARWMASCLGEEVGQTVGYTIRFDSRLSAATRIEVVTEGILTRRIQNDPLLEGVALIIFDEFHERSIHADLGLALCLDVQRQVREDLKLLVMSATLECGPLAALLGNAPVVASAGRTFPVEEVYLEDHDRSPLPARMAAAISRVLPLTEGDILVFLPGAGEIRACATRLEEAEKGIVVHQLYGDLPFDEQQAAILPGRQRKVVLATSIAETSLTIEGVRIVIDCGLSRRLRHDPASGMNRLVTIRESKASAEQRKGRAGRLAPGFCYRLFSRHTFSAMTPYALPEIMEADLAPLLLELAAWGVSDPVGLSWLDPPPEAALGAARQLLDQLGALDGAGRITPLGSAMAGLPLHPRQARLLLRARDLGRRRLGCDLAALVSERDIFRRYDAATHAGLSDISDRLESLQAWRTDGSVLQQTDRSALKGVERVSRQLERMIASGAEQRGLPGQEDTIARLLLAAYPDRLARRREGGDDRYQLAGGRGARLSPRSVVKNTEYIVAVDVDVDAGGEGEGIIHLASAVTLDLVRQELAPLIERQSAVSWSEREGRVVSLLEERVGAVSLSAKPYAATSGELLPVVLEAVRASRLKLLTLGEGGRQLQGRVALLRRAYPDQGWPDLSDDQLLESLDEWLAPHLSGVRTEQDLASLDVAAAVGTLLDYRQKRDLDDLTPTHLMVPSGSRIRLDYTSGELPVLAVKLQELFGLAETPTVAGGRVAVLLHLLSPAGRPIQVTQDLKGFWNGAYHQVKKELKGRYPKHPWPDDPWSAQPTRRTKPRS